MVKQICKQCSNSFLKSEMKYFNKSDGPYCKYCVQEWNNNDNDTLKVYSHKDSINKPVHNGDVGYDLRYYGEQITISPNSFKKIKLQIKSIIPKGYWVEIAGKSGLASKGITTIGNIIDTGYTGNWHVVLVNLNNKDYIINNGDKVCQAIIRKSYYLDLKSIKEQEINNCLTERGCNGFGSTGIKENKHIRILIEGIDKLGKTTLTEYIGKKYNLPIIHNVKFKNRNDAIYIYKQQENIFGVFDRGILSEDIYGQVFRNEKQITKDIIKNNLKTFDIIIIFIDDLKSYKCEKQQTLSQIKKCNTLYKNNYKEYKNDTSIIFLNRSIYNTKQKMFTYIDNIFKNIGVINE